VKPGLLAMAYGTPADRDDVERYYTDIRRGRPPAPEQLAELTARYDAIGGTFPLREITAAQVDGLRRELGWVVELGQKHAAPTIEDGVAALAAQGVTHAVGLVLAPHYSAVSIGAYAARAAGVATVPSWHLLPAYLEFLAAAVAEEREGLPDAEVVFTAHSIPLSVASDGDPYPDQVRATAEAVAAYAGLDRWSIAYQSAGRTPEPWLGPDVLEVIRARAEAGEPGIVVCPCGFTGDHLEVAYDLDVEAALVARDAGVGFARTRTVGADPAVLAGLADLARDHLLTLSPG
jgi:ferrochelatase